MSPRTFYEDLQYHREHKHDIPYTTNARSPHEEAYFNFDCPMCAQPRGEQCITHWGTVTNPQWIPDKHVTSHAERVDHVRARDAALRKEIFTPPDRRSTHPFLVPRRPDLLVPGTKLSTRVQHALKRRAAGLSDYPIALAS